MGSSTTPQFQSARVMRSALLNQIDHYLLEAVSTPESGPTVGTALEAFQIAVNAYRQLVTTLSTSSIPSYAQQDLPADERTTLARVEHNLKIMRALYGPKAG